ncbi:hypothetical protein DNTS_031398 [Danionella cerebrum]|uniref:N-acyl-aromatic-L-amino acid amidohydrolase n=1 Tax=Danionella cerebrum TaxID=2873325 RepID=A0A553MMI5_9TELE|nr:hypothetical protein DNTS_031398 [Danionella translucida]
MASVSLPALGRVAVCGGTHGNELSGVYLVQELERQRREKGDGVWPIPVTTVLTNPRAVKECRRYIDTDMNRCFSSDTLSSPVTDSSPYEVRRAQELNNLLGPKGSPDAVDMICDLHNTTSNMGLTLIHYTSSDWAKITQVPVRVLVLDFTVSDAYNLESVSKHGFTLEVGPQPQGVIRSDIFVIMKKAVDLTIDWIHKFNSGTVFEGGELEAYKFIRSVDYPRNPETGTLTAAIHPQLQDRDFCLLNTGDPIFLSFSGETIKYQEDGERHPFFINEGAYYEKGIAFHLARKTILNIPSMASVSLPALGRVAVCGGTHGNELSGVYLVQEMERQRREKGDGVWPIPVTTVLTNPRAVKECRRYVDTDMNRCFSSDTLSSSVADNSPYEVRRAHELNNQLGPKGSPDAIDLICDLHNTTSNMGLTLIHYTTSDWVTLHICKYLQATIEVGPQPHGVVRADIFLIMKEAVDLTIEWIHKYNSGTVFEAGEVEIFKKIKSVDYPRDPETGSVSAAIHPQLQDRDFCLLRNGDPMFLTFSGETVKYKQEEELHPLFINECAYYEKAIAFHLGKKMMLTVPSVQVQKD